MYVKALQEAVENNRDQLEPRKVPIQPSGWFMRWFIGMEEPPPKIKLPAPKKIAPPSKLTGAVVEISVRCRSNWPTSCASGAKPTSAT